MITAGLRLVRRLGQINWGLADQVVVSGGNFLTTLLLARSLGVEEFGRFTLAWMVVLFAGHLQQALILAPMMSIGPKEQDTAAVFFGAMLVQQAVFVGAVNLVIVLGAVLAAWIWPDYRLTSLIGPLVAANCAHQGHEFFRRYFFTVQRARIAVVIDGVRYLGQAALLGWWLGSWQMSTPAALWIAALTASAALSATAGLVRPLALSASGLRHTFARSWRFSRWLIRSFAAGWIGSNAFQLAAGALLGPAAVAVIKAAQTLMGPVQLFYFALAGAAPAEASRAFLASGVTGMMGYLRHAAGIGLVVSCVATLLFLLAPQLWLSMLFGPGYEAPASIIFWIGVSQALAFIEFPAMMAFRTMEQTRPLWRAARISAGWSVLVAFPAVAVLGVNGVVIGRASAMALKTVIMWRAFWSGNPASRD